MKSYNRLSICLLIVLFLCKSNAFTQDKPDLVLQSGHSKVVWGTAFSSDGRLFATSGLDQTIKIWSIESGYEIRTLSGNESGIPDIAFSPDCQTLASACQDKTVSLWDVTTGRKKWTMSGHPDAVERIKFSPDGRWLVSQGYRVGMLWEAATGRALNTMEDERFGKVKLEQVAFSNDGRFVAWKLTNPSALFVWEIGTNKSVVRLTGDQEEITYNSSFSLCGNGSRISACLDNGTMKIWKLPAAKEEYSFTDNEYKFTNSVISHTGRWLAACLNNGNIKIIDLTTGKEVYTLTGHQGDLAGLAFSQDDRLLSSGGGSRDHSIRVWEVSTGKLIHHLIGESSFPVLTYTPDNKYLISATDSKTSVVWDLSKGSKLSTVDIDQEHLSNTEKCISPDWKMCANIIPSSTSFSREVKISDLLTGQTKMILTGKTSAVEGVAFSPDGRWLASCIGPERLGGDDNSIRIWDLATGSMLHRISSDLAGVLAFSPDGNLLVSAGEYEKAGVELWEPLSGKQLKIKLPHTDVIALAFNPQGDMLLTGSTGSEGDDAARLWNVSTGQEIREFNHDRSVQAVGFSPDGKQLVTAGGNMIRIWNTATGKEIRTTHNEYEFSDREFLAVSPDMKWAVAQDTYYSEGRYVLCIFNISSGKLVNSFTAHAHPIMAASFSPDSRCVATASMDGTTKIWDVNSGRLIKILSGHTSIVNCVKFSPDGRLIATGSSDGSIRIWDYNTAEEIALLSAMRESSEWIVVNSSGLFDGSPDAMRKLVAWRFGAEVLPLEVFFNEFYYPELLSEIIAGKKPSAPVNMAELDRRQPRLNISLAEAKQSGSDMISTEKVKVRIDVAEAPPDKQYSTGCGAFDVRLFRNGSMVKIWRGNVLQDKNGETSLEATIPIVAGVNRLTAYAFSSNNIKSSDAEMSFNGSESLRRRGTAYILAIGINQYANQSFNLKYAVADARSFSEEMHNQQLKLGNFEKVEVIDLTDQVATKSNILQAIAGFGGAAAPEGNGIPPPLLQKIKQTRPEDALIIFFAGHGKARSNRFYLIPHDLGYSGDIEGINKDGLKEILSNSISDIELEQALEKVDSKYLLLVIDACNSGQAIEASDKRFGPMNSKGLAQLAYEKGMYILTAAQGYQAALEAAQLGHGFLTYSLVNEGLMSFYADEQPTDGQILLREWLNYPVIRVPLMQLDLMRQARAVNKELAFVEGEEKIAQIEDRNLQRPKVFYRREPDVQPLIIARKGIKP